MNGMKNNTACKTLYERGWANGKTREQALIALCNKFLKQVFFPLEIAIKPTACISQIIVHLNPKKLKKPFFTHFILGTVI